MSTKTVLEVVKAHNADEKTARDPEKGCGCVDCRAWRAGAAKPEDVAQGTGN